MLSDIGGPVPGPLSPQLCSPMLCFTAGTHRDPGGRRLTVSKSQLSLPVIEYFQSFQVGCKHLKNIIWNQIPQSLSGVHQSFIDAYDSCWGLWFLRQLRDCCLGLAAALWMGESSSFSFWSPHTKPKAGSQAGLGSAHSPGAKCQLGHWQEDFLPACLRLSPGCLRAQQPPGSLGSLTEMLSASREEHCFIPGQSQPNPTSETISKR